MHPYRVDLNTEGRRHRLDCTKLPKTGLCRSITNDRHTRDGGRDLLNELQPFGAYAELRHQHKSSDVAAWLGNTINEALGHRIYNRGKNNWEG